MSNHALVVDTPKGELVMCGNWGILFRRGMDCPACKLAEELAALRQYYHGDSGDE